jgi:hypothetical protein
VGYGKEREPLHESPERLKRDPTKKEDDNKMLSKSLHERKQYKP